MNNEKTTRERINGLGQCPICMVKPIQYKREHKLFCCRCNRTYDINTGEQIESFSYNADGSPKQIHLNSVLSEVLNAALDEYHKVFKETGEYYKARGAYFDVIETASVVNAEFGHDALHNLVKYYSFGTRTQ